MPYNDHATVKANETLANALTVLENLLADKTYLVGDNVTLADITVASALLYPFKFVADAAYRAPFVNVRSEEHTSELQSLMRISYAVFCLKKKNNNNT